MSLPEAAEMQIAAVFGSDRRASDQTGASEAKSRSCGQSIIEFNQLRKAFEELSAWRQRFAAASHI